MRNLFARFIKEEEGQDLIEYALLAAFIAVVAAGAILSIGTKVNTIFTNVNTQLGTAAS
jgi:pilus assembly protein Flp/PilA